MQSNLSSLAVPAAPLLHNWQGLHGSAGTLALAELASQNPGLYVFVATDTEAAMRASAELAFFLDDDVLLFPEWETLPYDSFSPHQDIVSERLTTLSVLPELRSGVLVVSARTLMHRLAPTDFVQGQTLKLDAGQTYDLEAERQRLIRSGYRHVDTVMERGEFAVRGSIVDVFPMGAQLPFRIDLFDDEVETLRTFDPESQRTVERIDSIAVLPAKEFPLDEQSIARFRDSWHRAFVADVRRCQTYQDISSGIAPQGVEYYLPLFFEHTSTLFDFLPQSTVYILEDGVAEAAAVFWDDLQARYESLRYDVERPILEPARLFQTWADVATTIKRHGRVQLDTRARAKRHVVGLDGNPLPDVAANHRSQDPARKLRAFSGNVGARVLFTAETQGRLQHLLEFLARAGLDPTEVDDFATFRDADTKLASTIAPLDRGCWLEDVAIVSETDVFGPRARGPGESRTASLDRPRHGHPQPHRVVDRGAGRASRPWGGPLQGPRIPDDR